MQHWCTSVCMSEAVKKHCVTCEREMWVFVVHQKIKINNNCNVLLWHTPFKKEWWDFLSFVHFTYTYRLSECSSACVWLGDKKLTLMSHLVAENDKNTSPKIDCVGRRKWWCRYYVRWKRTEERRKHNRVMPGGLASSCSIDNESQTHVTQIEFDEASGWRWQTSKWCRRSMRTAQPGWAFEALRDKTEERSAERTL